jgi:hypothetical protein
MYCHHEQGRISMKVFWSWQSDTPGKIGRHFVREALETAIEELKTGKDTLDESSRPESEDLHLDHDRKNLLGSPDLFAAIHVKIKQSTVFVGDITPVATTPAGKKVMNPNVAIELGIALEAVGTDAILFVMNKAYGDHSAMPFNLAHKSGPVMYELPESASNAEMKAEQKKLVAALKECVGAYVEAAKPKPPLFELGTGWQERSSFVDDPTMTIVDPYMGGTPKKISLQTGDCVFLRVFPKLSIPALTVDQLQALSTDGTLRVLYYENALDWGRTSDGFVIYALLNGSLAPPCPDYLKLFRTGEIWAVLRYQRLDQEGRVPLQFLINRIAKRLDDYSAFLNEKLGYAGEVGFVAGITGIKDKSVPTLLYGAIPKNLGHGLVDRVVVQDEKAPNQLAAEALKPFATKAWEAFGLASKAIEPAE